MSGLVKLTTRLTQLTLSFFFLGATLVESRLVLLAERDSTPPLAPSCYGIAGHGAAISGQTDKFGVVSAPHILGAVRQDEHTIGV